MRVLDLFAGIGGFSLAAHWCGMHTAAFVEWDRYNQKVLKKNFPGIPVFGDIKKFNYASFKSAARKAGIKDRTVDIVCGGFPCQPFSTAGKREGTNDGRYLWPEMLRVIREVQPSYVVGENVAGLLSMDGGSVLEEICTSLESEGYTVQPVIIPACAVGAPHRRDRVWILAKSNEANERRKSRGLQSQDKRKGLQSKQSMDIFGCSGQIYGSAFANTIGQPGREAGRSWLDMEREILAQARWSKSAKLSKTLCRDVTDASKKRLSEPKFNESPNQGEREKESQGPTPQRDKVTADTSGSERQKGDNRVQKSMSERGSGGLWTAQWAEVAARLCRVDDGIPSWVDRHRTNRLKSLGNAIVPQVAHQIFKAIIKEETDAVISN